VSEAAATDVTGRIDRDGCLVAASPELVALQESAGGTMPGPVAVPSIAAVSRLAQSLGILVSRRVVAAVDHQIVDFVVRAQPDGGGIALQLTQLDGASESDWAIADDPERAFDFAELESDGVWRCDSSLRGLTFDGELAQIAGTDDAADA
jgi:hypothetical protein